MKTLMMQTALCTGLIALTAMGGDGAAPSMTDLRAKAQ